MSERQWTTDKDTRTSEQHGFGSSQNGVDLDNGQHTTTDISKKNNNNDDSDNNTQQQQQQQQQYPTNSNSHDGTVAGTVNKNNSPMAPNTHAEVATPRLSMASLTSTAIMLLRDTSRLMADSSCSDSISCFMAATSCPTSTSCRW